jgi:integrase
MPVRRNANGKWFYRKRVKLPDGKRVEITGTPSRNTKDAAEQMERAHVDRVLRGEPDAVQKKEVPRLAEFEKEFVRVYAMTNNKPSEVASKIATLKHHLVPAFGHLGLDQIGIRQIEEFKASQLNRKPPLRPLDPKTVNNHLTCLRRLLTVAVEWELIDHVPPIKWLKTPESKFDFLSFEECERLITAADDEWRPMITVAAKTGMRLGELLALEWDDVDLIAGRLVVRHAVARGIIGTPKNGRTREIPLSKEALAAFKAHRHLRGSLVFCNGEGGLLKKEGCKWPLWRACKRAGLRRIGWHCLRHTFASHLVMRGAPIKAVQELLGHATIEMTMRYSHLSPDVRRDAVGLLDRRCITVASAEGQAGNQAG